MFNQRAVEAAAAARRWADGGLHAWPGSCSQACRCHRYQKAVFDPAVHTALGHLIPGLLRSGAEAVGEDLPDSFYELDADDFVVIARAAQRRAAADSVLMTRTAREAQARARAQAMPPVPVRLHFPDGSIVQVGPVWAPGCVHTGTANRHAA